jgi:hypothetical protein
LHPAAKECRRETRRPADARLKEAVQIGATTGGKQTSFFKENTNSALASEAPNQGKDCPKLLTRLWIVTPARAELSISGRKRV